MSAAAQLAPIESNSAIQSAPRRLRLSVLINGVPTQYVAPFVYTPPGRLSATRADLEAAGVKAGRGDPKGMIDLSDLRGVVFRYDEARQQIDFRLSDAQRAARVYDARGSKFEPSAARPDWGAIVNYTLYGASTLALPAIPRFSGANVTFDARAFGPVGALSQTGIVGRTLASGGDSLRLDSTYAYSDPGSLMTGRVGDTISGGLAWTRPIRLGGLQWQSDFALRGDLVTSPTPVVTGSAAVPSTVDVFLNNVKAFSQDVGAGPYQIVNLPMLSGAGEARVVVTDGSGRQAQFTSPFYSSPNLLAAGLTDFSIEGGFARRYYASVSDDYDSNPIGSATLRRGIYDTVTLESHAEGGEGLINAGAGAVLSLGRWGTASAAVAGSRFSGDFGYQGYAAYSAQFGRLTFEASSQRAFAGYNDLASVTAAQAPFGVGAVPGFYGASLISALSNFDPRPPKALDQISVGAPAPFANAAFSVSFINLVAADDEASRVLAASATQQLPKNASLYATVFVNLARTRGVGVFAGLSLPLGPDITATVGVSSEAGAGASASVDAQKTMQNQDGSYGWHVHDAEGATPYREVDASYRSGYGAASIGVQQVNRDAGGSAQLDGSIAFLGGGLAMGNHVQDGFAVVDAGAPGVTVLQENRPIGVTGLGGRLLVPDLRSYQPNSISIDPTGLPANAEAEATQKTIVPGRRSGVSVDFGVKKEVRAAMVILVDAGGKYLSPGSHGSVAGSNETFVVGYDGQAYIKDLAAANTLVVDTGDAECRASFAYAAAAGGKRPTIGPLPCR